ncbi:hypothetical protein GGH92_006713 [Coemansia sp. RSA 2673]|nr:hypothetical protein GGH92_006713 [Coemansia sp. RSA 2673]
MMASTSPASGLVADSDRRASMVKSWLAKFAGSDQVPPRTMPSMGEGYAESERSLADDATLFAPPDLPLRNRTTSSVSDNSVSSAAASGYSTSVFVSAEVQRRRAPCANSEMPALNRAQIDTAIALAVRARQEDQLGRHEVATRLLVASLERMSFALHDIGGISDAQTRERLQMLRVLLEPGNGTEDPLGYSTCQPEFVTGSAAPELVSTDHGVVDRAASNLQTVALAVATRGLDLLNHMVILWFVLLGNIFVWAATRFRSSQLPEVAAHYLTQAGVWVYSTGRAWNAPEHALRIGQVAIRWMFAADKETHFSQRILCSIAAILGAIARVAEQSSSRAAEADL